MKHAPAKCSHCKGDVICTAFNFSLPIVFRFACFFMDPTWTMGLLSGMSTLSVPRCDLWHTHAETESCTVLLLSAISPGAIYGATCTSPCVCASACVFRPLLVYALWLVLVIHSQIPRTNSLLALYLPPRLFLFLFALICRWQYQILSDIFPIILQYQEVKPCRGQTDI